MENAAGLFSCFLKDIAMRSKLKFELFAVSKERICDLIAGNGKWQCSIFGVVNFSYPSEMKNNQASREQVQFLENK